MEQHDSGRPMNRRDLNMLVHGLQMFPDLPGACPVAVSSMIYAIYAYFLRTTNMQKDPERPTKCCTIWRRGWDLNPRPLHGDGISCPRLFPPLPMFNDTIKLYL